MPLIILEIYYDYVLKGLIDEACSDYPPPYPAKAH